MSNKESQEIEYYKNHPHAQRLREEGRKEWEENKIYRPTEDEILQKYLEQHARDMGWQG